MRQMTEDQEILQEVLLEFEKLTKIPRKSGHEEKASRFLFDYAKSLGLAAVLDEVNNVVVEKPAAKGYEDVPATILQAHVDMVCVAEEGKAFDPLADAIEIVRDGDYMTAAGTSLGADDGMGAAVIMYLLRADFPHGKLRAIFTVDEEEGMRGAKALDAKYLDAAYMINCDSEDLDVLTVGSAGSVNIDFTRKPIWKEPAFRQAHRLSAKGFLGGHSGMEINCGRANAARVLALTLDRLRAAGVRFEIDGVNGGTARNAIASSAASVVAANADQTPKLRRVVDEMRTEIEAIYGNAEKNFALELLPADVPAAVLSAEDQARTIDLLCLAQIGVHSMSRVVGGLVETSANLGVVTTSEDAIAVKYFPRSSIDASIEQIMRASRILGDLCGFDTACSSRSPGWPENPSSNLAPLVARIFAGQMKRPMKTERIHAGLECGWFYQKNPKLDIVSIGPTISGAHSPQEKVDLRTVAPHVKLIMETLAKLKRA